MSGTAADRLNILLVDDQPAKLMSYEVILGELGENLIKAGSAREALGHLLKTDVALVLIDVVMPDIGGFELARMIREHPRFEKTALIFVSAIQITASDWVRGYEAGAVDYVSVPVVPELLRAKVKVFLELHRKTRELEELNADLERRVAERTAALEASAARLQRSEQRRSLALAAGSMGSWEWDLATDEYVWDEGQCRIFGVDPGTFRPNAENIAQLVDAGDLESLKALASRAAEKGESYQAEFRVMRPDGEVRWCVAGGAASRDEDGRPVRLSGVTHDITERKRAETSLRSMNLELERLVEQRTREREVALAQLFEAQKLETIGQFTGGVAHDFNNLLMAVVGSLELLRKRLPPDDTRALRLLDNAAQGADRGTALTQRLLAFARRQELRPQAVDLAGLIGGMLDLLERAVGPKVQIRLAVPDGLPQVKVDANQLELAVLNLAVNARDAMPSGGELRVSASVETPHDESGGTLPGLRAGCYVVVEVADTGVGMDEATLARASEPFFTTKGPGKGTGLGLPMVHGLAAQSGGAMTLSSQPGAGTTVALWLPEVVPGDEETPGDDHPNVGIAATRSVGPSTILLVDDDPLVRTGTVAMLEDLGHVVIEADSGVQALERIDSERGRIDLVITDFAMPGMNGLDLIRTLRSASPTLPVILASGFAELPDDEVQARVPRLSKPFRQAELAGLIAMTVTRVVEGRKVAGML